MPRLDIAVRGLLAAPVAAVAVPDASARNLELSEIILRRWAETASIQAWANVNGPGDGNISHHHPGRLWSGTYYIDDGGCADDPAPGGAPSRGDGIGTADCGDGIGAADRGDG